MIKQVRIKPHTEAWHAYRMNGYGGSEIASVVSVVSRTMAELVYTPAIKMHLTKIQEPINQFSGNVASESGQFFEPIILNWLRFFDLDAPDQLKMFSNIKNNTRINKVISPKVYITNSKFPWLFISPDGWNYKNKTGLKRYVETKHTTSMETRRFPDKISPAFYVQVQMGLMMTGLEVADLCLLVDGRWFEIISVEPSKEWFDIIADTSYKAWRNVLQARKIKLEYGIPCYFAVNPDTLTERQKEGAMLLSELEPPMAGTEGELEFVKEMVIPQVEETIKQGSEDGLKLCIEYLKLDEKEKEFSSKKKELYAKILLELGSDCNVYIWDEKPVFTYKPDKRGTCRLLVSQEIKNQYADRF